MHIEYLISPYRVYIIDLAVKTARILEVLLDYGLCWQSKRAVRDYGGGARVYWATTAEKTPASSDISGAHLL